MTSEARRKRSNIALGLAILSHTGLTLVALLFLFPFFWMISNALRRNDEVLAVPLRFFPSTIQWQNFVDAWVKLPFGRFFMNSMIVAGSVTLLVLIVSPLAASAFPRLRFPRRGHILLAL